MRVFERFVKDVSKVVTVENFRGVVIVGVDKCREFSVRKFKSVLKRLGYEVSEVVK